MKSKKPNNQINFNREFRRLGVFIEHVDSNVGLIAEQHGDIKKTLDSHTKILEAHTEMIGSLATDMTIVKTNISVLKTDMTTVKKNIEIMKTDVEFIKIGLKKKVDIDEFAALERRVLLLEKRR